MIIDAEGREIMRCGFRIGGGIDQDFTKSPQGYTDNVSFCFFFARLAKLSIFCKTAQTFDEFGGYHTNCFPFKIVHCMSYNDHCLRAPQGVYVTEVYEDSPALHCGLKQHDKILQVNGYDFTMVTHRKAVEYISKNPVLNMLIARKGVTHS